MHAARRDITPIIRRHWDRRAATFDDEIGHGLVSEDQRRAWLRLLSGFCKGSERRVLDVGCGTGFLAFRFAELGHTVTGLDLSPQMIDIACRKAKRTDLKLDFHVGDANALDYGDETYDMVAARHVVWNLPDPQLGVAEWLRVLRPGGRLAFIEGRWAGNERSVAEGRHNARFTETLKDAVAEIALHNGIVPKRFLRRAYRQVELELPFSGGPPADRLVGLLERLAVRNIVVEPLMDPALWGERPQFPRYLVAGNRPN
jgi:ubiquinone/menaquinone biosynthesis C-methylase UbiE